MLSAVQGIPAAARHEVHRERLLEVLHGHAERKLILLAAPAGFGKSTLAAAYARDSGAAAAWLTLHAPDRDSRALFARLADAIDQALDDGERTEQLHDALEAGVDGAGLARPLAADLASAGEGILLVLDDFHVVQDAEDVVEAIDALLRDLPEGCQVVITAREVPTLQITRLVASQGVFALGAEDLRFTPTEVAALRSALGGDASMDDQADGWVAGILLGGAPRQLGAAGGAMLGTYVEREVLGRLRLAERRWLETLSVVDAITPLAAERLLRPGPWSTRLAVLAERCPFLVPEPGGSYRLHGLVRESLLGRLRRSSAARAHAAWTAARDLAEGEGNIEGIVRACNELGRPTEALDYVRRSVEDAIRAGRWSAALTHLSLLPPTHRHADSDLALAETYALWQTGRAQEAYPIAEAVLLRAGREGNAALQVRALLELQSIAFYQGDHQGVEDWYAAINVLLQEKGISEDDRRRFSGQARGTLGVSYAIRGDSARALDAFEDAARTLRRLGVSRELGVVLNNLAKLQLQVGANEESRQANQEAIRIWRRLGDLTRLGMADLALGDLCFKTGDYEGAGASYQSALTTARTAGALRVEAVALASVGAWHFVRGRLSEAAAALDASLPLAEHVADRDLLAGNLRRRAEVALSQRDVRGAREFLRSAQAAAEAQRSSYHLAAIDLALASVHLREGALEQALTALRSAIERGGPVWGPSERATARYVEGVALLRLGRIADAERALKAALDQAEHGGSLARLTVAASEEPGLLEHAERSGTEPLRVPLLRLEVQKRLALLQPPSARGSLDLVGRNELPRLDIRLFGGFVAYRDGEQIRQQRAHRADRGRQLIAALVLHPGGLSGKDLLERVLSDMAPARALHNLQMTVYQVRQLLGPGVVRLANGLYQLAPGAVVEADVRGFDAAIERADRLPDAEAESALGEAIGLYRGPLLDGLDWNWVALERERYRHRFARAAERLAGLIRERAPEESLGLLQRAADAEGAADRWSVGAHQPRQRAGAATR